MENIEDIIEYYISEKEVNFQEIRADLIKRGFDNETTTYIIRKIDDYIIERDTLKSKKFIFREIMIAGYIFLIGGGLLTVTTYTGIIDLNGWYILSWGPVIAGYSMLVYARQATKIQNKKSGIERRFSRKSKLKNN